MVYLILIVLLLILIYHYDYQDHTRGRREWFIFIAVYFILMAGLRYRIGGDTVNYSYNYPYYPDLFSYWTYDFENSRFGRGYLFLGAIAKTISDNFVILQCILSFYLNIVLFTFFYRNTTNIFTAALLYFFLAFFPLNMEVLRESCSVASFIMGWKFYYSHKWIKYYICCVLAILFHPSALITLIFPLFTLSLFKKIFTPSLLTGIIGLGLFFVGVLLTSKFFDIIQLIGMSTIDDYAQTYQNSKFGTGRNYNLFGSLSFIFRCLLYPLIIGWLVSQKKVSFPKSNDNHYCQSLMIMFLCYVYISSLSTSLVIINRFNNYLLPFLIVIMADVIFNKIKLLNIRYKLSFSIWALLLAPYIYINTYGYFENSNAAGTANIHRYYPYSSIIDPKLDRERELLIYYIYFRK